MSAVSREQRHTRRFRCPVCGGADEDLRGKGKRCNGYTSQDGQWVRCSREEFANGMTPEASTGLFVHRLAPSADRDIAATYDYEDETGELLFQVVRKVGKKFRQRKPDGAGGWVWKLNGARRVLYRLPELLAAGPSATVWIVEGERDVETLESLGRVATCNPGGAGKWGFVRDDAVRLLAERSVVIVADRDAVGYAHAQQVASTLPNARTLECSRGKDVTEHLAAGGTLDELVPMSPPPTRPSAPAPVEADTGERPRLALVPPLPVVRVNMIRAHEAIDATIAALAHPELGDPQLFTRSLELVTVARAQGKKRFADGTPVVTPHEKASLFPRLTRFVDFRKYKEPSPHEVMLARAQNKPEPDGWTSTTPNPQLVASLLAKKEWSGVRALSGITETPVLRPDGSVHQKPGYDDSTGYLYLPTGTFPPVPESPTQAEASAALAELCEVFREFPYAAPEHVSVPLCAILTVLARPAIEGSVPAFVFDASTRGSGKTLQADVIALITTGRCAARCTFPRDDEAELEKVLAAYAIAGARLLLLDNVVGRFGGAPLDKALTARDDVELRVLGKSEIRRLPWGAVVMAAGNNISPGDDTMRRVLVARLESDLENPELRTGYAHDPLLEWVRGQRPRLVTAALTVLRAYTSHGSPKDDMANRMASFEEWSWLVPAAIRFAGGPNPLLCRPSGDSALTDETGALVALLHGGPLVESPFRARDLISALYPAPKHGEPPDGHDGLREAVEILCRSRFGQTPSAASLGYALKAAKGRVWGGRRLTSSFRAGHILWRVS